MHMDTYPTHPDAAVQQVAASLLQARRNGGSTSAATLGHVRLSDAQAYAVQSLVADALGWFAPDVPAYWKSGGASRTSVLTHARLPVAGVRSAGDPLGALRWHVPAVEAEIVLRLGQAVSPAQAQSLDHAGASRLVDAMAVAIEIADSRWTEGLQAPADLRLADQGSHGALLLGEWLPWAPHDWAQQDCEVCFDSVSVVANTGAYSLGDPSWLLPLWLRHATRNGQTVAAGSVVTTGSWVGAIPWPQASAVEVNFPGLGSMALLGGAVHAARDKARS